MSRLLYDSIVFFFSSRRRHTRFDCDWSSDVCSSDLAADDVVRMTRYVLLVPGEHDQVVPARELVAAANGVEVVVGEEVDAFPGSVQPGDEVEIPVVEAEGNSEVEEWTLERDTRMAADVPRVDPSYAVGVLEVVPSPGVRRQHDRYALRPEALRPHDERGVPDAPVRRDRTQEIQPARPVARAHHAQQRRSVSVAAPVHR